MVAGETVYVAFWRAASIAVLVGAALAHGLGATVEPSVALLTAAAAVVMAAWEVP